MKRAGAAMAAAGSGGHWADWKEV